MRRCSTFRTGPIAAFAVSLLVGGLAIGCADGGSESLTAPMVSAAQQARPSPQDIGTALAAQNSNNDWLMGIVGVAGTAVGLGEDGTPVIKIFAEQAGIAGLPEDVDGVPVVVEVTGMFVAYSDPKTRQRPAPVGFSVGHPQITAGSIGFRLTDGSGNYWFVSNNHVLANQNDANLGDSALQPGPTDGGSDPADKVGELSDYESIVFSGSANNTLDAAIASTTAAEVSNSTPTDDGYGTPSSQIYGDGNGDGFIDNTADLLGLQVQKYGRTTELTTGEITEINVTVNVCYLAWGPYCFKLARFVDQIGISDGTFSAGGDSGSGIVTNDADKHAVGLLFAGSSTRTLANRIDLVLDRFGLEIDGEGGAPPPPVTDIAVTDVSAPASALQGSVVSVDVTVENVGNQDVTADIDVDLDDDTDAASIGTQTIGGGLTAGASTTLTFSWNTAGASLGDHTLTATQKHADDDGGNDSGSTTVAVELAVTDIAVTDVSAPASATQGDVVSVDVTVENVGNQDVSADIDVDLDDDTDAASIGTQTISGGLNAGASTTLTFSWNTAGASLGAHTLTATQQHADDDGGNDSGSTNVTVNDVPVGGTTMHVGDLDGSASGGGRWTATVTALVLDDLGNPVSAATVSGNWSAGASGSSSCTTGGDGRCSVSKTRLKKRTGSVTFTVSNVTHATLAYDSSANTDPDGDSNGTSITVSN